jgi:hypothetical protein
VGGKSAGWTTGQLRFADVPASGTTLQIVKHVRTGSHILVHVELSAGAYPDDDCNCVMDSGREEGTLGYQRGR